jgi:DNA invertase Pin-like site-specific DNA recombinase
VVNQGGSVEHAGVWVRVSTADQAEASQVPDIERHCQSKGYAIARRYELYDKSASKGEQQAKLDEMLTDMREGTINVLVCWHSDRVERRGPEVLFRLLRQIKDAGGKIESTKEPLLGTEDLSGEAMTAINAVIAHQESVQKSERQRISIQALKVNGSVFNNVPWGFDIVGPKYSKTIVPTDLCRVIVPQIFERCIAGDSLRTIAALLDAEGIPTPRGNAHWNESTVRWIIKSRTYAGRLQTRQGETVARCEAVIPATVFDRANAALKARPKRGPVTDNPPMLGKLKCARCGSPMYRIKAGSTTKRYYYRCFGSGPQRRGCGNMIPLERLDTMVAMRMLHWHSDPYQTREWVEGENWDEAIAEVKQDIREVTEAERWTELPALTAKLNELRSHESRPGHYVSHDTDQSIGEHFYDLDNDGRREYLKSLDVRAERTAEGIRLVIDGREDIATYAP